MKLRLLTSLLAGLALGLSARAQTTVSNTTYSGQTTTVLGPSTVATSGTVAVTNASNVTFAATGSITLNAGFSCSGSTFQASADTTPPSVPSGLSYANLANTSFTLNWAASTDNLAGVDHYEVSQNGVSLGTFTGLSAAVTGLSPSTLYTMTVRAVDKLGNTSAWSPAYYVTTKPFAVTLTAPTNNAMAGIAPATVALAAIPGGTDGTVSKVEFYQGSTLISTVTSPNGQIYQFNWTGVTAGNYTLTAKAYDSLNEIATSTAITIKIDAPPTVSITAPASNALIAPPGPITLTATASDTDGTVSKVDFYQGTTLLGTATSSPYQITWSNVAVGDYTLTAKATDNDGGVTTSSAVPVIVGAPPSVSLTAPANNASYNAPVTFALTASASSSDSTISKVDFYDGTTLLGTVTSSPYQFTWEYAPVGSHSLTAKATDALGAATTSSAVNVTISSQRQSGTAGLGNNLPSAWATLAAAGDTTHAVGITTGQLSVDKSGAATYTIALFACPGTAGMEPKLSLNYSSQAGAGILGYGWSLSGVSAISRGPQTRAIDGQIHGVDFSTNDRYYLDGQRLIAINGSDGGDGTEYRTEMDSFSRIVSYGTSGNGPAYFKVWTKAGLIIEFGHTSDSALAPDNANGSVLTWSVNKISDTKGNYMAFTYSTSSATGEQRLTEIDYTGNDGAGLTPYNSVQFTYESRDDTTTGYVFGAQVSRNQRLKHIIACTGTGSGATHVRDYQMDYSERPNNNRSILDDIREIGAGPDYKAYPPLTFSYNNPSAGFTQNSNFPPPIPLAIYNAPSRGTGFIDLNGDGLPDFVQYHTWPNGTERDAWINTPGGWVEASGANGQPDWRLPFTLADDRDPSASHVNTRFIDFDADGRPDYFAVNTGQTGVPGTYGTAWWNNGAGWTQSGRWSLPSGSEGVDAAINSLPSYGGDNPLQTTWFSRDHVQFVDLNGDGLPDCVCSGTVTGMYTYGNTNTVPLVEVWINRGPGSDNSLGAGWQFGSQTNGWSYWEALSSDPNGNIFNINEGTLFVDLNGDGLPDVGQNYDYYFGQTYHGIALNTGTGFRILSGAELATYLPPQVLNTNAPGNQNAPIGTELVDLNGDGIPDFILRNDPNNVDLTYFNTGNGWIQAPSGYLAPVQLENDHTPDGSALLDIDNDGMVDLVHIWGTDHRVYLGTGSTWTSQVDGSYNPPWQLTDSNVPYTGADFVDINGDGAIDEVWNWQGGSSSLGSASGAALNNRVNPDRLITVTTGMGVSAHITYKPLTDRDANGNFTVYTKGSGAVYPEADVIGPMYVVSQVTNDDGIGGQYPMNYTYAGLRSNALHGSEGFATMTVTDGRTGIVTTTDFRQDYPFIGMAKDSTTTLSGQILTSSSTHWTDQLNYSGVGNVHFPYADTVVQQSLDLISSPTTTTVSTTYVSGTSTTTSYDNHGNALTVDVESINADGSTTGYEKDTTNVYGADDANSNGSGNWFLGRLTDSQVTAHAPGVPVLTRESSFTYYSDSGLLHTETVEPSNSSLTLTTTYGYDAFGNKNSATVSGTGLTDANGTAASRATSTAYDTRGQFPLSTTNALNQTEDYTYDTRWGVMTSQTGPNNLTTTWSYDGMGRKVSETRPDGTITQINYRWAGTGAPANSAYLIETDAVVYSNGTYTAYAPPSLAFYDNMGRATYSFGINGGGFDGNLKIVGTLTQYDSMSRAWWTSLPFYYGDPIAEASSVTSYDVLNRPLTQRSADEEVPGNFVYTNFAYNGLVSTATNPKGQATQTTKNSQGQVLSVITNSGAATGASDRGETDYTYDAFGNVLTTSVANNNSAINGGSAITTSFLYDLAGRKTQMTDPDMGTWHYAYDAAGELTSQTDAKGQITTVRYDQLGRLVRRDEIEGTTTWTYDTAAHGIGKLAQVDAPNSYSETYVYDSLGRPYTTTRVIKTSSSTESFSIGQDYDPVGRPTVTTYPGGYQVKNVYNAFGFLKEVRQASVGTNLVNDTTQNQLFWQADTYSVWGGVDGITNGNMVTEDSYIANTTGRVLAFGIGMGSGNSAAAYTYVHDSLGNLVYRADETTGRTENYIYDGLNRLTQSALAIGLHGLGTAKTVNVGYDSLGNITSKSDVGTYTYGQNGAGPHAVTAAGGTAYTYDPDGNMTSSTGTTARSLTWRSFNQVSHIAQGSHYSDFTFDASHQRATQVTDHGSTVYVGSAYERFTDTSNNIDVKYYIFTPSGRSVVRTVHNNGTVATRYFHQDALGSIVAVTDETGAVQERYAYDPWGQQTQLLAPSSGVKATTRGFTDHEMLSDLGLIHMNGRIYDPVLGRFLSADPNVDQAANNQSYNRYSYLSNNPLGGTDPTGFHGLGGIIGAIVGIVAAVVVAIYAPELLPSLFGPTGTFGAFGTAVAAGAAGGFASGFSTSLLNGGSIGCAFRAGLIGGAWGALSAAVTFGIGQYFDGLEKGLCVGDGWGYALDETGRIVAHGVADGLMSEAQGGQFRSGFYAGAFSSAAGSLGLNKTFTTNKDLNYVAHVAAYAAVGGTASVLGGGKFANGATTGAFTYMFNDAAEQLKKINSMKLSIQDPVIKRGLPAGTKDNVDAITAPELHTDILGDTVTATLTGTIYIKADAYDDPDIRNELIAREMEHYDDASALLINNYAGRLQKNLLGQPNDSAAHTYLTNSGKYFSATYNNSGLFWDGNGYHSMRVNADGYPVGGYAGGRPSQAEIERYRRTIYGGEP